MPHIAIVPLIGLLLILAIAWYLFTQLTLPQPVRMVVIVVACMILILWVASLFGLLGGGVVSLT